MKKRKLLLQFGLGILIGVGVVLAIYAFQAPYGYQGSLIDPPKPAADFTLSSSDGTPFRLSQQRGDTVLLFFGYTHCPDICPTTLYDFSQIEARLGAEAEDLRFVFITVDPKRDSLDVLDAYVSAFDADIVALGGSMEELQPVWDAYGVYRQDNDAGSAGGYFVDHTARVYVINPEGDLRLTFPFGMEPEAMADDLRHLLDEAKN
jgi:protein SCO1/2